jgi:hypothetical protein
MDLNQTPNKRQTNGKPNANRWTYIRLQTNKSKQETECQWLVLHPTPNKQKKKKVEQTHTQKKEKSERVVNTHQTKQKGCPERYAQSPAYVSHLV